MPSPSNLNETASANDSSDASAMLPSSAGQTVRRVVIVVLFVGVAVMMLFRSRGTALDTSAKPLPVVGQVPEFSLTERSGKTVTHADLLGTVWVADFVFTTCAGPCPELSLRMRSLQKDIVKYGGKVKTVSFSIDPTYDQPPVLQAYAKRYQADPDLWWFLTCNDDKMMHDLVKAGFLQAVTPAGGGAPIIHSTQFVLIDQQGRIRSWHDGLQVASKALILKDIEFLLAEPTN
jgi:cytochrome oxidase Cu insertion factor (SCO1/SenC/PrrC family)